MYGIFSYIYHKKSTINVGKYTSPMDPKGIYIYMIYQSQIIPQVIPTSPMGLVLQKMTPKLGETEGSFELLAPVKKTAENLQLEVVRQKLLKPVTTVRMPPEARNGLRAA